MLTLWRNLNVASCDEASRIHAPGAVLTDGARIA